jgi:osmotically-inducible protein OsmY
VTGKRRKRRFLRGAVLGWLAAYLFDPGQGRRRRAVARDWTLARARRVVRRGERAERYAVSTVTGKAQAVLHRREAGKPQPDDATLIDKVESIVFRDPAVPKGQISLNAENGVVWLRGEVPEQSMIDTLVARVRGVHGVRGVESLLHLPGQEAPMHG